jgi:hypothetical protein
LQKFQTPSSTVLLHRVANALNQQPVRRFLARSPLPCTITSDNLCASLWLVGRWRSSVPVPIGEREARAGWRPAPDACRRLGSAHWPSENRWSHPRRLQPLRARAHRWYVDLFRIFISEIQTHPRTFGQPRPVDTIVHAQRSFGSPRCAPRARPHGHLGSLALPHGSLTPPGRRRQPVALPRASPTL